jgi:hypothetical protein
VCSSKICKDKYLFSKESLSNETRCSSKGGSNMLLLNDRYLVDYDTCKNIKYEAWDGNYCIKQINCQIEAPLKISGKTEIIIDETSLANISENVETPRSCKAERIEILNLESNLDLKNLTFILNKIKIIETCLIIRNSSAFFDLSMFKRLESIEKGCELNGLKYQIILEDNENFESFFHENSLLNIADVKIYAENNPKLKDSSKNSKCTFSEASVDIFVKNNSALIVTDFDMEGNTKYCIKYENKFGK